MEYRLSKLLQYDNYTIKYNRHTLTLYTSVDMPKHRIISLFGNCGMRKFFYIQRKYYNKRLSKYVYVLE